MNEFDTYVLGFGGPHRRTYVQTFLGQDNMYFLSEGFSGWHASLQGVQIS